MEHMTSDISKTEQIKQNIVEDFIVPEILIKEELDPLNIKEEPVEGDIWDNISKKDPTVFVDSHPLTVKDIKTEETFSDDELVTDDDAVSYMLSDTESVEVSQEVLETSEIKKEEPFIKKEKTEWKQSIPLENWKFNLKSISFIDAVTQIEKRYQIKMKPNANEFKDYYILTSDPEHNDVNAEWKLLIPVKSFPTHNVENIAVNYDPESDRFDFTYSSNNLIVKHVEDLTSFMQGILGGKNLLLFEQNLRGISDQFEKHFQNGNQLIPSFTVRADESVFIFETMIEQIGDEEVPEISEETYAHLTMLTSALLCKPKLTINGVPYQLTSPSVRLMSTVCDDANKAYEVDHDISDIKEKYETGQYITDEELDPLIKVLQSKIMKTCFEKEEIRRLKARRRSRKKKVQYHQMSAEQKEALRKRDREMKKARYNHMCDEQKEALRKRKRDREQKKARSNNMIEEKKQTREQKQSIPANDS